jgi:hypothetical protein
LAVEDKEYIVTEIHYKCPKCGHEYSDYEKSAVNLFSSQIICKCGFVGELPQ